ncbi:MAG: LysE family transporter [Bacteroidales bacterium]|nr:LysE family transporter [Bacteroidales bacterium]
MPHSLLPTLLLYILIVGYSPGPANLYSLSCSLKYGRKRALRVWHGMLCGFAIAVTIAAVATHLLGTVIGDYLVFLKYLGAAYILWLAYCIWRSNGHDEQEADTCTFFSGLIVQLTNAKMILFDLTAFSIFVLPYSNSLTDLLEVAVILHLAGPGANLVWLLVGSWLRRGFLAYRKQVDVVMAVCLALCALLIIFS